MAAISASISERPLDVAASVAAVQDPSCGGTGVFVGTVRSSPATPGRPGTVVALEYEAHPVLAETRLRQIAGEAADKWDLAHVSVAHRSGRCELGEPTVIVACGAAHRAEALDACRWIIDTLKSSVPIWKKELYADGSSWITPEGG